MLFERDESREAGGLHAILSGRRDGAERWGEDQTAEDGSFIKVNIIAGYRCIRCGTRYPADLRLDTRGCPKCLETSPSNLRPLYPGASSSDDLAGANNHAGKSLWQYGSHLPPFGAGIVSLGEGLTPLVTAARIGEVLDVPHLFIKDESRNPTWSHKDRFSTVAVSAALSQEVKVVATASSGNAGASLAAYAARAGLECVVATFAGAAGAMISQIRAYGATVFPMARKTDRWALLEKAADQLGWFVTSPYHHPVVGSHPIGIEGYKTLAYEIVDQSDDLPDWCVLPVCYGDALAGVSAGFYELLEMGKISRVPRLVAAEVHGSLSAALENGHDRIDQQEQAFDTIAVSIGTTRSTYQALKALRDTRGCAVCVSNDQITSMQRMLAAKEGIFAELASVAPLVAVQRLREQQVIAASERVVAIVTAGGLKDLDISVDASEKERPFESVDDAWTWALERTTAD